jgi:hypothetical protein
MTHDPNNNERLKDALRTWSVQTPLPPRFQENVWQRIEAAERLQQTATPWTFFLHWLSQTIARPAVAVAYVTVLAVIGVTFGLKQVQDKSAHLESRLGQRYVQSVDPFQMPRGQ